MNNTELLQELKEVATKCGLRDTDIAVILGESRCWLSQLFRSVTNLTDMMRPHIEHLISFFTEFVEKDLIFKKSIRESSRDAVKRRKKFTLELREKFISYIEERETM